MKKILLNWFKKKSSKQSERYLSSYNIKDCEIAKRSFFIKILFAKIDKILALQFLLA